ncbi:MAG TPA: TrkA family potassium uptake protein [Nannocystaceae bacterium]|nr:TrkA family potassium uptake protein [Nannocystaceae bacterium]
MTQRILVIGLGRFGTALAESLAQHGCEVVAVDTKMEAVDAIKSKVTYALEMDTSDPIALRSIDPHTCQAAVVAIGENFESAVLSVAALRELGHTNIIARATTNRHSRIFYATGAHRVLELESEMGRALGRELAGGASVASAAAQVALSGAGQAVPTHVAPGSSAPGHTPGR